jgi:hypothetical protein
MLKALQIYLVTLGAFFLIDMIWLGLVAKNFYRQQLGFLMASRINWAAAIIFYLSQQPGDNKGLALCGCICRYCMGSFIICRTFSYWISL